MRKLRIFWGGRANFSLDKTSPYRQYVTTMKAIRFKEDFPALCIEIFKNHYNLVFELTSMQHSAEQFLNLVEKV